MPPCTSGVSASCSEVIRSAPRSSTSHAQPLEKWSTASCCSFWSIASGAAERVVDQMRELAGRLLPFGRRQALPEEAVVPQLGAVVEQLAIAGSLRRLDDLDQRGAAQRPFLLQHRVGLGDIGLVVLAVVEFERFRRHVRGERVLGIGQFGQLEGHRLLISGLGMPLERAGRASAPRPAAPCLRFGRVQP